MSRNLTLLLIFVLILLADLLWIRHTLGFWRDSEFSINNSSSWFLLIAQAGAALALLAGGGLLLHKTFLRKI